MADRSGERQSQLYLLRVWTAPAADGTPTWRGKLQPVLGDHSYDFASALELLGLLATLLAVPDATAGGTAPTPPPGPEN